MSIIITRTIPAKDGYAGLTEATDGKRTIVVCGTGPSAVEALRAVIEEGRKDG